jgi:transposase InsO family protein
MNKNDEAASSGKEGQRLQAVLALFKGHSIAQVCQQYNICRSDLFKFKCRALLAMKSALADERKGPRTPVNKLSAEKEQQIRAVCERHPTLSSYKVHALLPPEPPVSRTIQRVRRRLGLPRLTKRDVPRKQRKRFSAEEKRLAQQTINNKLYLGPLRLAWDLQNQHGLQISASTVGRMKQSILTEMNPQPAPIVWQRYERKHPHSLWHGDLMEKVTLTYEDRTAYQLTLLDDYSRAYVFCDLFREVGVNTTIRALIAAMRAYRTIPKALVFDNGSYFKGALLKGFCQRLGIRLIHSSVNHPQTNGKLERAFRDDMKEFYKQREKWIFNELRRELPAYVEYRNQVRGCYALQGKPSSTRLQEQNFYALPSVLDRLESYAWCARGHKTIGENGSMHLNSRWVYINPHLRGQQIELYETLEGLQAEDAEGKFYLLRNYRKEICPPLGMLREQTRAYYFQRIYHSRRAELPNVSANRSEVMKEMEDGVSTAQHSPRIAVAYSQ